jgi:hypothetical protein
MPKARTRRRATNGFTVRSALGPRSVLSPRSTTMREMNCLTRAPPPSQVFEHSACRTITTPAFGPSRQMRQSQRFRARSSRKPNDSLAGNWPKAFNVSSPDHRCALPDEIFNGISARRPATRPSCRAVPEHPPPRSCAAAIGASPTAALGRSCSFSRRARVHVRALHFVPRIESGHTQGTPVAASA